MPPPERKRNSRRSQKYWLQRCDISLPQIQELVEVQQHVRERVERLIPDQIRADGQLAFVSRPRQRDAIRERRLRARVATLLAHAFREERRLREHERVVQQRQRLRWH